MFSKFNQTISTIFLDVSSKDFSTSQKVNVVLSPSLYWVKKVSLPVKYLREVKPLIASLFEDILPPATYSYFTYKKEEYFYIFAYEDKMILDTLKDKGIASTQVHNVYFSQSEFDTISIPIKIDEAQSICVKDELVILLPTRWMQTEEDLDISTLTLSKHFIRLNQLAHLLNNKSLYKVLALLALLMSLVGVEYFIIDYKTQTTLELRDEFFSQKGFKATMMQNHAMFKEYSSLYTRQMNFRKYCSYIVSLKLLKTQKLSSFSLKNNKLIAEFTGISKGGEVNIVKHLKNDGLSLETSFKSKIFKVEISL